MNTIEPFTSSIDWSNELFTSLVWIVRAWAIAAACTIVVLVLIARYTVWGRQFWHVTGEYFSGRQSVKVWLWLAGLLLSVITGVRLSVLFTYQANDLNSAIQVAVQGVAAGDEVAKTSGITGFWMSLVIFCVIAVCTVTRILVDLFVMQRFMLAWRTWLTDRLTADWLDGRAYYRSTFIDASIDNPDQRIQFDIDVFTAISGPQPNTPHQTSNGTLPFGAISAIVSVVSFTAILWNLSGDLSLLGFEVPRAMFWFGFVYVAFATVIAFWLGRPLIRLSFNNEKFNAAFRYALVRLRDAAESVAFYRGENAERGQLRSRFEPIVSNYQRFINKTMVFTGWNLSMNNIIIPLPWVLQAPRLFAGQIKLGDVTSRWRRSARSRMRCRFSAIPTTSSPVGARRSSGCTVWSQPTRRAAQLPKMTVTPSDGGAVELDDVEVRNPAGETLVSDLNLQPVAGRRDDHHRESGTGKTTLLRSLAQLWPFTSGTMRCPPARTRRCSCPSCPTSRWAIFVPWCPIRIHPATSPTKHCVRHWNR